MKKPYFEDSELIDKVFGDNSVQFYTEEKNLRPGTQIIPGVITLGFEEAGNSPRETYNAAIKLKSTHDFYTIVYEGFIETVAVIKGQKFGVPEAKKYLAGYCKKAGTKLKDMSEPEEVVKTSLKELKEFARED